MPSLKAALWMAFVLCLSSPPATAQQPENAAGSSQETPGAQAGDGAGGTPGGQGGAIGPGGEGSPGDGEASGQYGSGAGAGAGAGAGGPGSGPDSAGSNGQEPQMVGDRSESAGETGIWLVLLFLIVVVVVAWKRVGEWGKTRLEPAVEQLHRAASSLDTRSRAVRVSAWSPSHGVVEWVPVLGESWILSGAISVVATSEDGLAEQTVIDLLMQSGSAVGLVSGQVDSACLAQALGPEHQGRLLLSDDPGCLQDGIGSLIGALEASGSPIAVVADLRSSLGGTDILGSLLSVASGLRSWVQAHDLALVLVLPRGLSVEAMSDLLQTPEIDTMARFEEGRLDRIESAA